MNDIEEEYARVKAFEKELIVFMLERIAQNGSLQGNDLSETLYHLAMIRSFTTEDLEILSTMQDLIKDFL